MSKINYNKISTEQNVEETQPALTEENVNVEPEENVNVEPEEQTIPEPNPLVIGIVSKCTRLNVRKKPNVNSEVVCEVPVASKLKIDMEKSTSGWYKVCTADDNEGFCMKEYVTVEQ